MVNNYYTNVVVNKTVNITNVTYVNQRVPGAVAATSAHAFTSGQPIVKNAIHVDSREVASAPVNAMTPPAVPERESVLGGRTTASAKPPAAVQTRTVVAKKAPPPPPISFTQRQSAIQSNGGKPLSITQSLQIARSRPEPQAPQVKVAPPSKPAVPRNQQTAKTAPPPPANQPMASAPAQHPPTAHPTDDKLEQQHLQQSVALHQQQDQEYQKIQQKQEKQAQQLQQKQADEAKVQQAQQQHQAQLQALEQKHQQELQQLQQKQEAEHQQEEKRQAAQLSKEKARPEPKDEHPPK